MKRFFKPGLLILAVLTVAVLLPGCSSVGKTVRRMSDNIGDKALRGHALVNVLELQSSDATANGSPTGKVVNVIGDLQSIPMTSKDGEVVKDYFESRHTETPAWYNSDNVTVEDVVICTGDNAKLAAYAFLNNIQSVFGITVMTGKATVSTKKLIPEEIKYLVAKYALAGFYNDTTLEAYLAGKSSSIDVEKAAYKASLTASASAATTSGTATAAGSTAAEASK